MYDENDPVNPVNEGQEAPGAVDHDAPVPGAPGFADSVLKDHLDEAAAEEAEPVIDETADDGEAGDEAVDAEAAVDEAVATEEAKDEADQSGENAGDPPAEGEEATA
jgi:hypothetical protein